MCGRIGALRSAGCLRRGVHPPPDLTGVYHGAEDVHNRAAAELGGHVAHVIGRADLDELHTGETFLGDKTDEFQHLPWQQAAGFGRTGPRCESNIDHIDIKAKEDGLAVPPCQLQRNFRGPFHTQPLDVTDGQDRRVALACDLHTGPRAIPATDADLDEVRSGHVGQLGGVEPWCRVHPLIHVPFLDVDVPVQVDDANLPVYVRSEATDIRVSNGVVTPDDHRKYSGTKNPGHSLVDLVEGLFDVGGNDEDVADVDEVKLLLQVNREVERVAIIEGGDTTDGRRPEARTWPVGRAHVERRADDRYFVPAHRADVLQVRRLEESVDAGKGGLRSPDEC